MDLVNLTPHPVVLFVGGHRVATLPPSGQVARCDSAGVDIGSVSLDDSPATIPLLRVASGELSGLPSPAPGRLYVVSRVAADAIFRANGRCDDIVFPERFVRDATGAIIGCEALGRF